MISAALDVLQTPLQETQKHRNLELRIKDLEKEVKQAKESCTETKSSL